VVGKGGGRNCKVHERQKKEKGRSWGVLQPPWNKRSTDLAREEKRGKKNGGGVDASERKRRGGTVELQLEGIFQGFPKKGWKKHEASWAGVRSSGEHRIGVGRERGGKGGRRVNKRWRDT